MAGEDENKRIVLRIPRTNPELHAEIHKYPVDYRAKRLLYLASIGLMELVKQGMIEAPFANQAPVAVGSAPTPYCGFHAIRPPSPLSSGQAFHGHLATCSTAIRPGSRSAATQGLHC